MYELKLVLLAGVTHYLCSTNESTLVIRTYPTHKVPMSQNVSVEGCVERAVSVLYIE